MVDFTRRLDGQGVSWWLMPLLCVWLLIRSLILSCIGAVKGSLILGPVACMSIVPWVFAAVISWPQNIYATYHTAAVTMRLGPNLRILTMLLLPLPLTLWPFVVAIGSAFYAIIVGFFWPMAATVAVNDLTKHRDILNEGVKDPLRHAEDTAKEAWKLHFKSYFGYLRDLRQPYYGEPLDVRPLRLLSCLALSLLCGLTSLVMTAVLGAVKLPALTIRALWEYVRCLEHLPLPMVCLWGPFWLIGLPLVPALVVAGFAVVLLACLGFVGPACGIVAYGHGLYARRAHGGAQASFEHMYACVRQLDATVNDAIGACFKGCDLPKLGITSDASWHFGPFFRQHDHEYESATSAGAGDAAPNSTAAAATPAERFWSTFTHTCTALTRQAVSCGWLTAEDLGACEAFLFIGLPGLTVMQLLLDAADMQVVWPAGAPGGPGGAEAASRRTGSDGGIRAATALAFDGEREPKPEPAAAASHDGESDKGSTAFRGKGEGAELAAAADEATGPPAAAGTAAAAGGAGAGAGGAVTVALADLHLAPAAAQELLQALALEILNHDIGYNSAANPGKLHKALASIKPNVEETRYMACHTLLVGGHSVRRLLAAAAGTSTGTGTGSRHNAKAGRRDGPMAGGGEREAVPQQPALQQPLMAPGMEGDVEAPPPQQQQEGQVGSYAAATAQPAGDDGHHHGFAASEAAALDDDGPALAMTDERSAQLHAFTAAVQSIATALSRKRRCQDILGKLMSNYS